MKILDRIERLNEAIDCDSSVESCDRASSEVVVRPSGFDLFNLTITVGVLEVLAPFFSILISVTLFPNTQIGNDIVAFLIPAVFFAYPNIIWALLTLVYFIFGNNIFIFNWVDTVLAFLIQYLISMLTPTTFIFGLLFNFYLWLEDPDERGIITTFLLSYALEAFAL